MKKLKKYLLMVPLLAVMLLNCFCYGQVILSANAIDYSEYFKPVEDCPHTFDFTDVDSILNKFQQKDYYFYAVYITASEYEKYISGSSYEINFRYFDFDSDVPLYESSYILHYQGYYGYCTFTYDSTTDSYSNFVSRSTASGRNFIYYKNTGSTYVATNLNFNISSYDNEDYFDERIYYFQYTNIPDFPLFYDYEASQSAMNVNVTFSPELTGAFNRTVTDRGQKVTLDEFSFTVENNSKFDVQYLMAIHKIDDSFVPIQSKASSAIGGNFAFSISEGRTFIGNPSYVYVKDEWIYYNHTSRGYVPTYAPSCWHMVSSGSSDSVTINFNQLNINSIDVYDVVVYAVRNDFNYVSPYATNSELVSTNDYHLDISAVQLVYTSRFNILNPAEFNPHNNDNSYAYDSDDSLLFNRANGYIDENGEIVIDKFDTKDFTDSNYHSDSYLDAWETYYKKQNTVSSDIDQLSNNFSSFFKFINKTFSYFPKNYQNTIMLGLTSIVVLAVIKVVF